MLFSLLAPTAIINKLLFIILLIWTIFLITQHNVSNIKSTLSAFIIIIIFMYGFFVGFLGDVDTHLSIQFFLATLLLLLIHFVGFYGLDMDRAVEFCGKVMILFSLMYLVVFFNIGNPLAMEIFLFANEVSLSSVSSRDFGEGFELLTVALGTAPFLFIPWCLIVVRLIRRPSRVYFFWFSLYGFVIGLSGARGLIVVALIFLIGALISIAKVKVRLLSIFLTVVLITIGIIFVLDRTTIFSAGEVSNSIKIDHFRFFINALDVPSALFGNGLGSYYLSGKGVLAHTELTPVDMVRYFGFPLAILLYWTLIFPVGDFGKYKGPNAIYTFGFFLFLILSITNPTLINSYGMIAIIWYWAKINGSNFRCGKKSNKLKLVEIH